MPIRQRNHLSTMDDMLSGDPVLSHVVALFAEPPTPPDLVEYPARPAAGHRFAGLRAGLRRALSAPEFIAVLALTVMVVCAVLGGVFGSAAIALGGLAAPLLLGVGCYFAIKRREPARTGP